MLAPLLVSGSNSFIHLRVWAVYIWGYEPFSLYTWFCKNPIPRWASWNQSWHNWAIYNFQNDSCRAPKLQLETCGFCWDLWGDFSWGRTHRSQCVLTGDYILEGLRKMRKLILDLMLEAANHRFQDTTGHRICLTSFSEKWIWNEGIALDLFHVDSMPRLHLFRWFVNPPLDALKNRWHLTSFIGCNTVFIALLDDGVNYLDLTQEITKNPPSNRHFRLLHDIWVWSRWFTEIFCHPGLCLLQRSVALWLCLGGESSAMVVVGECSSPCRKYGLTPWKLVCHP